MNECEIEKYIQKAVAEALAADKQQRKNRVLYNTRMLMDAYIDMKKHVDNAISEAEELDTVPYMAAGNTYLSSVRKSKTKTALMLANIDRALMEMEKEEKENATSYKYEAFYMHYVEGKTFEDIAEKMNTGKNTPSRWVKELIRKMSVKLFGIDGIEKW